MGGAGLFGDFEHADCIFCWELSASPAVAQRADARGATDHGFVPSGGECLDSNFNVTDRGRRADNPLGRARGEQKWLPHADAEILAFLAALVSASLLFILL
jgi:hypothetical protein